jgi:hypothetical protein
LRLGLRVVAASCGAGFLATAFSWSAVADSARPRVTLTLDSCIPLDPAEVRRGVALELGAVLAGPEDTDTTQVGVSCKDSKVVLEVIDPISGKSLSRRVDLEVSPQAARSRLLALAIAELVTASWSELDSNPEPRVPPASTPPSPEARAAARQSAHDRNAQVAAAQAQEASSASPTIPLVPSLAIAPRLTPVPAAAAPKPEFAPYRLTGLVEARSFRSEAGVSSLGFGARLSRRFAGVWGFGLDLLADHGSVSITALGNISVDALSTGPFIFAEKTWGWFSLSGGAGLRLGVGRFSGNPTMNATARSPLVSPWGGPLVEVAMYAEPIPGFVIELGGEIGEAPFPAGAVTAATGTSASSSIASLEGSWVGAHAGVGVSF